MVFAARAAAHPAAEELLLIPTYPDHPPDDDEATRTYIIHRTSQKYEQV